eukprot:tig00001033_g6488.t1
MGGTDAQPRQRAQRAHLRALGLGLLVAGSMLLAALASASAHPSSPGSHERPRHADRGAADSPSSSNVNAASAAEPAGAGAYDRADVLRQLEELRGQMEHLKDSIASSKRPSLDQLQAPPAGASHEQNTPDKTAREAAQRQHALEELARRKARREEVERLRAAQEGHYIVGLKDGATEEHAEAVRGHARAAARRHHGAAHEEHVRIRRSFSRALRGFSARSVRASFPLPLPPPPPLLAPSRHTSASKLSPAVRAELEGHEHVNLVIAGIDAAIASIQQRGSGRKAVVLIALSSAAVSSGTLLKVNPAYTDAFARLRAVDALPITAAGNQYADACDAIPGNSPGAINVGASDQDDYRAGFSNWGSCVDVFAPGQNIETGIDVDGMFDNYYGRGRVKHGTSYAAALVAGAAALYRGANPSAGAAAVEAAILDASIPAIDAAGLKGAPNRLLNTRALNLPGIFRLDVYDNSCPPSNPLPVESDGACRYTELPVCGQATLVSTPETSLGLNQTALYAKAAAAGFLGGVAPPAPYERTRDLVVRVQVPVGSGTLASNGGSTPLEVLSENLMNNFPVGTRVSICSPDLDFFPTLYFFYGCPTSSVAARIHKVSGCEMSVTAFYTLPPDSPVYVVVEGVITGERTGNFTLTVSDPDCDGYSPGAGPSGPGAGSGSGGNIGGGAGGGTGGGSGAQQCFAYSPPVDYYDIPCPPPMTLSRLAAVRRADAAATFCGAPVPDLKSLLFAEWGRNVSLWQSEAPGEGLLPAVTSYPSNSAWTAAGLPTSHSGVHQLTFNVTNASGRGPRGACTLELRVVDNDGPFARARCPAREQELLASAGQCTVPAPNLVDDVVFDGACMRPVSGAATAVQSIAPGTPLMVGESYEARIYSSAFPAGASCPLRFRVRRAAAPKISVGAASPAEIAGVVGGSPAPVPVDLSFSFDDACGDHAQACRLNIRAAGDPAVGAGGTLADPDGSTCSGDLKRVLLSPYIRPDSAGAAGEVARTYQVALACAYGPASVTSAAWSIPVRRP